MQKHISEKVKHIVVLMMENRSFDHIFGDFPGVNGVINESGMIKGRCYNLPDPYSPPADPGNLQVSSYPVDILNQPSSAYFNPQHLLPSMMTDLFGPNATGYTNGTVIYDPPQTANPPQPFINNGFLSDYLLNCPKDTQPSTMSYFKYLQQGNPGRLNVLHSLAENYCVCDNWFCDVPNNTLPNRMFMHAATCYGHAGANTVPAPGGNNSAFFYKAKSIYEQISDLGKSWGVYHFYDENGTDHNDAMWFQHLVDRKEALYTMTDFFTQISEGSLPFYSFLNLSFAGSPHGNTMHPSSTMQCGENYIADVYNALRQSCIWGETLFVVTFDENGGIFDHVTPPETVAPDEYITNQSIPYPFSNSPDPKTYQFDYSMLGPRIPALLISPWIEKGKVHSKQLQNTSILRFAQDIASPDKKVSLTYRDYCAPSFEDVFTLEYAREDCLQKITKHANCSCPDYTNDGANTDTAPTEFQLEITNEFFSILPGHEDSWKPITRSFPTQASLRNYIQERHDAAKRFYLENKDSE